jgi:hypothetical protein
MKQTCIPFDQVRPAFDLLTSLAQHGGGELLEQVASFLVPGRSIKTHMVVGDESGWRPHMYVASHGRITELKSDDLETMFVTPVGSPPLWMSHDTVHFTGIASGGMLHLTVPPTNLEVVNLTAQDRLSVNTFVDVDRTSSEHARHMHTYNALMRRGTVFIRKSDGTMGVTIGDLLHDDIENSTLGAGDEDEVSSYSDVREMVRKVIMPVEDGVILEDASSNPYITLEVVSKSVVLKTKVETFGRIPVAFRLDSMAMATHTECSSSHYWSLLVPEQWMKGCTHNTQIDLRNFRVKLNKPFVEVASAIVDHIVISNSALVSDQMPTKTNRENYHSFFDHHKVRRTPEGCRIKVAALRKTASTSAVFARMCVY